MHKILLDFYRSANLSLFDDAEEIFQSSKWVVCSARQSTIEAFIDKSTLPMMVDRRHGIPPSYVYRWSLII